MSMKSFFQRYRQAAIFLAWLAIVQLITADETTVREREVEYARDIAPLLAKYCIGCHKGDTGEAGLAVDSYSRLMRGGESGVAIVPGDLDGSLLVSRVTGKLQGEKMPPKDEPQPTNSEIATLLDWVRYGAIGHDDNSQEMPAFRDIESYQEVHVPTALSFTHSGSHIVMGRYGAVMLKDLQLASSKLLFETAGKVNSLCIAADGSKLVSGSGIAGFQGEAILWDLTTGVIIRRFLGHQDSIYSAKLNHDGTILATASYDGQIILWNVATGAQMRTLLGHNGAVFDLSFSPDSNLLASASADATVKIWKVDSGERLDTLGQPLREQYSVEFSPDGRYILAAGEDNRIRMWQVVSRQGPVINPLRFTRFAHESSIQDLQFTSDGKYVVSLDVDGTIKAWSADSLQLMATLTTANEHFPAIALSPNDDTIAIAQESGVLTFLKIPIEPQQVENSEAIPPVRRVSPHNVSPSEVVDTEPNDSVETATHVQLPFLARGHIRSGESAIEAADCDYFRFHAVAGEEWVFEVRAARDDSPLDSHLRIVDGKSQAVPRVKLHAVRDSYFTFRGKDSDTTGDFRLHNWQEMRLNQYLYAAGEVTRLFHYPRGPDSGFNVYPNYGKRRGYFDTTPVAHALHEPCYVVEPVPPGTITAPNGLPVFTLSYENDDDSLRQFGRDSRLSFTTPTDGDYCVCIRDVRGFEGSDYKYELIARQPIPDFRVRAVDRNPIVAPGTGTKIGFQLLRTDGFDGTVTVTFDNLPRGFTVPAPLQFEPGHEQAWISLLADRDAPMPNSAANAAVVVSASAVIDGHEVQHPVRPTFEEANQVSESEVGPLGEIRLGASPKVTVRLAAESPPSQGASMLGTNLEVIELRAGSTSSATISIDRHEFDGRVGFGNEGAALNAPHGVYVDNIGLNGVLIVEGENERQMVLAAEDWVVPQERIIFVESDALGQPTSQPVVLRILPPPSDG